MNTEVISAFLDNEVFEPGELAEALADPAGRATLLQLIALRHIVQPAAADAPLPVRGLRRGSLTWMRAAVVLVAIGAGFAMGTSLRVRRPTSPDTRSTPPAPTIVVRRTLDAGWQPVKRGE